MIALDGSSCMGTNQEVDCLSIEYIQDVVEDCQGFSNLLIYNHFCLFIWGTSNTARRGQTLQTVSDFNRLSMRVKELRV